MLSVLLQVNVSRFVTVFLYIIIMVQIALAFVATALVSVQASPFFSKRIAQTINQSTVKWEAACVHQENNTLLDWLEMLEITR